MDYKDTSSFFTSHQSKDVPRDRYGRYELPDPYTGEEVDGWTRATTFAATLAESYGLRIWKERQVVWGLSRRPDLITLASTIVGPEDKKALGSIVDEAHIAAGTDAKANRGTAIHKACQAAERGAYHEVPEDLRPHVAGYFAEMKRHRLKIVPEYVERVVVVPRYHVGGQLDNLVRCPDGKLRVCDKKTGDLDYADIEFLVQLALYANATHMFDYTTNTYIPMPEIAKDYAIIMHIDPETGVTEGQRVNIGWGWEWARTCAEVMDIRKTKHGIVPLVPPTAVLAETANAIGAVIAEHAGPAAQLRPISSPELLRGEGLPLGVHEFKVPAAQLAQGQDLSHVSVPLALVRNEQQAANDADTVPGGYVNSLLDVAPEYQAFWSDSRHFDESEEDTTVNGVPLTDYGKPTTWPCARGEACEFTGSDGLHPDGTVCAYGNARPVPIDAQGNPTAESVAVTEQAAQAGQDALGPLAAGEIASADESVPSNVDVILTALTALKDKAAVQTVARRLMKKIGIEESAPDAIALKKYKIDIAKQIVNLAYRRNTSIPGQTDEQPDFGIPTGPAPTGDTAGKKAKGAAGAEVSEEDQARAVQLRAALSSISTAASVSALQAMHAHYSTKAKIGWTEEMQQAAKVRALQLDAESGQTELSPLEQIQGATSKETLAKVWQKVTNGGQNKAGWTPELSAAAIQRNAELNGTSVATNGNE